MARKRILICDDDPVILRLLEVNLELEGYDVVRAQHGLEAVEKAVADPPDMIILDIMMPRMDGYQACTELKSRDETKHIPVVFLSAKAQPSDIEKGKSFGVDDYLTKPFEAQQLFRVIEKYTGAEDG